MTDASLFPRQQAPQNLRHGPAVPSSLFRRLFHGSAVAQVLVGPVEMAVLEINGAALDLCGCPQRELRGRNIEALFGAKAAKWLAELEETGGAYPAYFLGEIDAGAGKTRAIEFFSTELAHDGRVVLHWILHDVTARREREEIAEERSRELSYHVTELGEAKQRYEEQAASYVQLTEDLAQARDQAEENEKRYRTLAENSPVGIWHLAADGGLLYMNSALRELIGGAADLTDEACHTLLSRDATEAIAKTQSSWDRGVAAGCEVEFRGPTCDGVRYLAISGAPVADHDGSIGSVLATVTDVTDRKKAEETIRQMAHHDALTGLANRNLFHDRLTAALANASRTDRLVALMFVDLDNFKDVNDTYGHPTGDALLQLVAERLNTAVRQTDTLARLGGDEFGIIFTNLESVEPVNVLARRIVNSFAEPVVVDGSLVKTGVSIGISLFPHDDNDPDQLIRKADLALYQAKGQGRNGYRLYNEAMHSKVAEQTVVENDLRVALVRGEFELHFQPQLSLADNSVVGAEALVRWRHPSRGLVSPGDFIPVAEQSGLIRPLGEWILRSACAQGKAWRDDGRLPLLVAVNLSALQLDGDLCGLVESVLEETGFDPNCLELELTEGMMIERPDEVSGILKRLSGLGVNIAIDDFGTGYSSLARLKRFPVNKLKIDRSFIRNLDSDPEFAAITEAIVRLGHSLNLKVIAEGVETEAQVTELMRNGCDEVQGFLYCRPLPANEFEAWLRARSSGDKG